LRPANRAGGVALKVLWEGCKGSSSSAAIAAAEDACHGPKQQAARAGQTVSRYLQVACLRSLARCAGVHVDFHAHRHFDDLRCFPGHFLLPSISWRKSRAARQARAALSRAQAGVVRTRLRCWTCRNGRPLADIPPGCETAGKFRAHRVLPKSEIVTFFVMRGNPASMPGTGPQGSPAGAYLSRRSSARPARDFSSFASSVPSLSGSAALKRCSTTARYSSSVKVPS